MSDGRRQRPFVGLLQVFFRLKRALQCKPGRTFLGRPGLRGCPTATSLARTHSRHTSGTQRGLNSLDTRGGSLCGWRDTMPTNVLSL